MPTQTYFELLEMLEAEQNSHRSAHLCPVCRLTLQAVDRLLHQLSLEQVNDIETRRVLRAAGGFCNRHAYMWAALHDALGTAIIFEDLLRDTGRRIQQGDFLPRRSGLFGRPLPPGDNSAPCPLCLSQQAVEERIAGEFAAGFDSQPRFRQAYAALAVSGLCLPHFRAAAARLEGGSGEELGMQHRTKLAATQAQLREIIEKMDAGRKLEVSTEHEKAAARAIGEERLALVRAVWQMVGLENLC